MQTEFFDVNDEQALAEYRKLAMETFFGRADLPTSDAVAMSLQPGSRKTENGKTYTLNENHRWTVDKNSPGQGNLFDKPRDGKYYDRLQKEIAEAHQPAGDQGNRKGTKDFVDLIKDNPSSKEAAKLRKTFSRLGDNFNIYNSPIGNVLTIKGLPQMEPVGETGKPWDNVDNRKFSQKLREYASKVGHVIELKLTSKREKEFWESEGFVEKSDSGAHWTETHKFDPKEQEGQEYSGVRLLPKKWRFAKKPKLEPQQFAMPTSSKEWAFNLKRLGITPDAIKTALQKIIPAAGIDGLDNYEQLKNEVKGQGDYSRLKIIKTDEFQALDTYLGEAKNNEFPIEGRYKNGRNANESGAKLALFHNFLRVLGGKEPLSNKQLYGLTEEAIAQLDDDMLRNKKEVRFLPSAHNYDDVYFLLRKKLEAVDNKVVAMSLQPGSRKTEDGKEYVLNRNSRWERADKDEGQKRATTRDEVGENGELYQPGQFISTVDKPKKKRDARIAAARERKQNIAPYTWEKPPSAYHTSIFARYVGTALQIGNLSGGYRSGDELSVYEPFKAKNPELDWDKIQALADKYNQGDRWFQTEENLADQAQDEAAIDSTRIYEVDVLESASGETTYRPAFEPRDFIPYKLQPGTKNSDYVGKLGTPSENAVPDIEFIRSRGGKLTAPTKAGADYLPPEVAESGAIATEDLPVGQRVNYRIDIPTFNQTGKYVGTLHVPGTRVAAVIGYTPVVRMKNVKFMNNELTALKIMEGADKTTVAAVEGEIVPFEMPSDEELNRDWIPVGYNPVHSVFYYDKRTGEEVRTGDESINIGNTIFVKKPAYGDRDTEKNPYDARYASIRGNETKNVTDKAMQGFLNQLNRDKLKRVKKRESESEHNLRMALQPGMTKSIEGKTYVLNQNHRWTLRSQGGLFGDDFKPGKWTPEEHEKLTGEKKGKEKAPQEHQNEMFDRGKKDDLPGQNLLFEDEDGVERKPSESERSLAASDGDTAYHQKARKVVARHYLATKATFLDFKTQEMKPLDPARVTGMMDGVDLSKPVVVGPPPSVPPPEQMAQWQAPGGNRGGYFSTVDAIPSDLGIGELATAWGLPGKPILKRERKLYSLAQNPNAHYMRSTAKETTDSWGAEGMKQKAMGGGLQWFIPEAANPATRIREF